MTTEDLQARIAELETKLAAAEQERDALKTGMTDFNSKLATELAKHGIRSTAAEIVRPTTTQRETATQRVLREKGFATLEELNAHCEREAAKPQSPIV